ncbi:SAVED domain-containing protein [Cellulomonas fimi]|uniref:SAVED domain-containing protein n=1 Tax=Cellulomonas fimi TaxID=1708 RepID=UPI00234E05AB|nr:SAVED domain-containing protein [Cellulomonas fimi]MDC7120590.1 SAVED domain-containing protein [Cellulomonas fimi]
MRRKIPTPERMRVWVRSGGRCAVCGRYLLEGKLTHEEFSLGELAHIVGQQTTKGSPRGDYDLPVAERDLAENLMLVCADDHDEIDRNGALDTLTVDRLRKIKHSHEDWVRRMTGLDRSRGTAVVRMIGAVRGNVVELSKPTASAAVLHSDDRFPEFPLSYEQYGFEIDLRHLPAEGTEIYWTAATAAIDEVIEHKLNQAVRGEHVRHLSLFAFARLPLLVYLGSRLDDTYEVAIYQRHRSTNGWAWPEVTSVPAFAVESPPIDESADAGEPVGAALVLNVSGTIQPDELPQEVADLPRHVMTPVGQTPGVETISSPAALDAFTETVRALLSRLEVTDKHLSVLHVFAAMPLSAGVALGRARDPHVHPPFLIYDRTDSGYTPVLEIS